MGILDGIVKGIADMIPEEGKPELKAFKAQNELKDIAAKENNVFARLGKQLYADGGAEKYPDIKAELDALTASRQEVEARIRAAHDETTAMKKAEEATGAFQCPQCGAENPQGASFCQGCGSRLAQVKQFCPQCGIEMTQGSRFCGECGTKIEQQS